MEDSWKAGRNVVLHEDRAQPCRFEVWTELSPELVIYGISRVLPDLVAPVVVRVVAGLVSDLARGSGSRLLRDIWRADRTDRVI